MGVDERKKKYMLGLRFQQWSKISQSIRIKAHKIVNNILVRPKKFIEYEVKMVVSKAIYDKGFEREETSRRENEEIKQGNKKRGRN